MNFRKKKKFRGEILRELFLSFVRSRIEWWKEGERGGGVCKLLTLTGPRDRTGRVEEDASSGIFVEIRDRFDDFDDDGTIHEHEVK